MQTILRQTLPSLSLYTVAVPGSCSTMKRDHKRLSRIATKQPNLCSVLVQRKGEGMHMHTHTHTHTQTEREREHKKYKNTLCLSQTQKLH